MIAAALSLLFAKWLFFNCSTAVFFCLLLAAAAASVKWEKFFGCALMLACVHALYQSFLFPLASWLQDTLPNLSFPSGLAQIPLAVCAGFFSALIFPQRTRTGTWTKTILAGLILVFALCIDRFAFSAAAFNIELAFTTVSARLMITPRERAVPSVKWRAAATGVMIILAILATTLINSRGPQNILAIQEKNAWATDDVPYNDSDWTLKSAYSYSLLYELMGRKHDLRKSGNLATARLEDVDALFFMTPTKPFTEDEKAILGKYLENGGKAIFIADHTDLYGHARAINSFTAAFGLKVRDDAVFVPHERHAKALLENLLSPMTRLMTSSSIALSPQTATLAFCHNFIAEKADYTRPNFFAEMRDTPDDRYGTFPLVTATMAGKGQIVICSESTVFSNFGIFQPGILKLLDITLDDSRISSLTAFFAIPLFALAAALLLPSCAAPRTAAFLLMILLTRTWYVYLDRTLEYYDSHSLLLVKTDERHIFEPDPDGIDEANDTASFLFAALPRLGLQPHFTEWPEFIPDRDIDLFVDDPKTAPKLRPGQKLLSIVPGGEGGNSAPAIPGNLSDWRLGNWWAQIGVSPYRRDRVKRFVEWIRENRPITEYAYPEKASANPDFIMRALNDKGETRTLRLNSAKIKSTPEGGHVLVDEGIWAMKAKNGNSPILIGGDSFNDRRNAHFFSRYWFGKIPDAEGQGPVDVEKNDK